jgi:YHS domain-containing protein
VKSILTTVCMSALLFAVAPVAPARAGQPSAATSAPKVFSGPQKEGAKATCPVTGEEFTITKDAGHATYQGKHVYFCCPGCKKLFDQDPAKYVK